MNDLTNKAVITSIELLELLNCEYIKNLHSAIRNMFEKEIKEGVDIQTTMRPNGSVEFYTLNEFLSKMFVMNHDLNCVERLNQYWINKKSEPKVIEQNAKVMMVALEIMASSLNLSNSEKVKAFGIGMQSYPDFVKALPVYAVDDSQIDNHVDVNTDRIFDMKFLLEEDDFGFGKSVKKVNKKLVKLGLLERKVRISPKGKVKYFNSLTEKGLIYGLNVADNNAQGKTTPYYYEAKIEELLMMI